MKKKLFTIVLFSACFLVSIICKANSKFELQKDTIQLNYPVKFIAPKYENKKSYSINEVPNPKKNEATGFISDPNNVINDIDKYLLNRGLWRIEQELTAQIAVVVLPSIGQGVPKKFAVELFEKWRIGQSDNDNGLLILTIMDQRRTEFEVGYGLEPFLTDLICHRIGTDEIVPYFKKREFGKGFINAVNKIEEILKNPNNIDDIYSKSISYEEVEYSFLFPFLNYIVLYLILTALMMFRLYEKIKVIDKSKEDYYDKYNNALNINGKLSGCLYKIFMLIFPVYGIYVYRKIKRKMKEYRYAPRFSRINGKRLFFKHEWDENKFLKEVEVLEEKLKSVEYDVWATEDKSDVLVLGYEGSSRRYSECSECGYKTYGRSNTKILKKATYESSGEQKETYLCRNCHYTESFIIEIPKLIRETEYSNSSGSNWSNNSSSSSWNSGSSSSSSSWGGGSSGGGGAGVSW